MIGDVLPAEEIVAELVRDARAVLTRLGAAQ
jgi:hypothetical protein